MGQLEALTAEVQSQYAQFPFPPLEIGALQHVQPPQADARFAHWYVRQHWPEQTLRILDAGCGTGFSTLKLAEANPEAEIVALDLSQPSLELAQARLSAAGHNPSRLSWVQGDLQQPLKLGAFDYIHSSGVIHHLPDPAAGLAQLRAALKPEGVAYFMVYSALARSAIQSIQAIVYSLWRQRSDWHEGLMICRSLFRGLPASHPLKQHYLQTCETVSASLGPDIVYSNAFLVDTYLQRCEHLWTQPQWFALLTQAGFEPRRWLDEASWEPESWLPGLPDYLHKLEPAQKWALADQLRPAHNFALYVTPTGSPGSETLPKLIYTEQVRPVAFGFVKQIQQGPERLLDNGRGSQIRLDAATQCAWEQINGERSWQAIWHHTLATYPQASPAEFRRFAQLLLDYGLVAVRTTNDTQ